MLEGKCLQYMQQQQKNQCLKDRALLCINREKPKSNGRREREYKGDFIEEEIQTANKYIKRIFKLVMREIQFKTIGYYFSPTREIKI